MIFFIVLLIVGVVGGVVAYVILQFSGVGSAFIRSEPRLRPGSYQPRVSGSLIQRLEDAPQGCLWGAIAAMALWILLWVVVLILALRVLLA